MEQPSPTVPGTTKCGAKHGAKRGTSASRKGSKQPESLWPFPQWKDGKIVPKKLRRMTKKEARSYEEPALF